MTSRPVARREPARRAARAVRSWFAVAYALASATPLVTLHAQARIVAAVDSNQPRPDAREGNALSRLVTVQFADLPLGLALHQIAQAGHLRLSYSSDVVPVTRRVSVSRVCDGARRAWTFSCEIAAFPVRSAR